MTLLRFVVVLAAILVLSPVATYSLNDGTLVNWRRESDYEVPAAFGIHSTIGDLALWDGSNALRHVAQTSEPRADVDAGQTG